jgi:NTE family protein
LHLLTAADQRPDGLPSGFLADLARLYPDLDPAFLRSVGGEFEQISVAGGHTLMRRGDPSDSLYILVSGLLVASLTNDDGQLVRLGEIGRGELIGEMSLLSGGTRNATVTALRDSRLIRISNSRFLDFMQRHPSVTRQFIQILTRRLTQGAAPRQEKLCTLALVPGGAPFASGAESEFANFVRDLASSLRALIKVLVIDRAGIESRFPEAFSGPAAASNVVAWLNDEEQRHDVLLYVCDTDLSPWSRLCLRQADRILVVARADAESVEPGAIERHLEADRSESTQVRGRELLLLQHATCDMPLNTARWLERRSMRRHHHLRVGDKAALERLCRHLLGRSIGLALGGGGAKAFAEVGVLRALAEAGIPVDVIGGTSMGSVVGALSAMGQDPREIHASLQRMVHMKPFSGFTLPLVSLFSGKRLGHALQQLFGDVAIEDLWRRYFCVACSLTHGTVKAVENGQLRRWLGASCAVPGIMPPLVDGGELFVDGGLLNNVPADLMAQRNAGPVIAVNVSSFSTLPAGMADDADLSGWSMLLHRWRSASQGLKLPRMDRLMVRSTLLASSNHAAAMRSFASLYLTPPLQGVEPADWRALDSLVETGYAYASKALESWDWTAAAK